MKKLILVIVAIVVLGGIYYGVSKNQADVNSGTVATIPSGWKTYTNKEKGFEFSYPEGGREMDLQKDQRKYTGVDDLETVIEFPENIFAGRIISLIINDKIGNSDANSFNSFKEEYIETCKKSYCGMGSDFVDMFENKEFSSQFAAKGLHLKRGGGVYFFNNNKVYIISPIQIECLANTNECGVYVGGNPALGETYDDFIVQIARTFRFTK